jgi:hypothetical protein
MAAIPSSSPDTRPHASPSRPGSLIGCSPTTICMNSGEISPTSQPNTPPSAEHTRPAATIHRNTRMTINLFSGGLGQILARVTRRGPACFLPYLYRPGQGKSRRGETMASDSGIDLIDACRERLGPTPRDLPAAERQGFRLQPSLFMRCILWLTFDKLRVVLRDQDLLRDHGQVVWGQIVQANNALFSPGNRQTLPANVLYSTDAYYDDNVEELEGLAHGMFELKGTVPKDPELRRFAQAISDEMARTMRLEFPESLCEGRQVIFTTCLIHPPHLPGGYLARGFFPLLICPKRTDAVMILPARYWPRVLRRIWTEQE